MKIRDIANIEDLLVGSIPTDIVINALEEVLLDFENTNSVLEKKEVIEAFYKEISRWEIILITQDERTMWMQLPLMYFEVEENHSFSKRLSVFFKKGLILSGKERSKCLNIVSNTSFPVELPAIPKGLVHLDDSNVVSKFHFSTYLILKNIKGILASRDKDTKLSVYEKPAGIVAMNKSIHHLTRVERETGFDTSKLKGSIEVVPFSKLISESVFLKEDIDISQLIEGLK